MGKLVKFCLFMAIILLFFTACDVFNAPLKEYIENATGRAAIGGWLFTTQSYEMGNGIIAIPPSDEAEYTKIIFDIGNPNKGSIKLEMEGDGSEFASVNLNNNGQASITIKNQKRGFIFDLSLIVYVNGKRIVPKKLPKMENRYFNNEIISLDVKHSAGFSVSYDIDYNSYDKNYWLELISGDNTIQILVNKHKYSSYTINGTSGNIITVQNENTIIPIVVTADCGKKGNYTLTVYKNGNVPNILVINKSNGFTNYCSGLSEAYRYIGNLQNAEIKVYKDIKIIDGEDLFNMTSATKKEISILSDKTITILLEINGSMFTINKNITLKAGGGKGTLTLEGKLFNDSPLIKVNEGTFELYEGAEIYNNIYNTASNPSGGGVSVTNGTFNMYGGSIKENIAFGSMATSYGGGVYITDKSIFYMKEGSIKGNKATNTNLPSTSYGGGVSVTNGSTFNMDGGTIGGYYWDDIDSINVEQNSAMYGSGVYIENSTFNFNNGIIGNPNSEEYDLLSEPYKAGNSATGYGGGVYVTNGIFKINGGSIEGNSAGYGGGVFVDSSNEFNMSRGSIKGNYSFYNGGGVFVSSSTFFMKGGSIEGNDIDPFSDTCRGGGVYATDSDLTMDGGTIGGSPPKWQNSAKQGGGVYMDNSTFNFYNGVIGDPKADRELDNYSQAGNYASQTGGGVYVNSGTFTHHYDGLNIYKGLIMGNWAGVSGTIGGGVYVTSFGTYNGPPDIDIDKYFKFNHPDDIVQN